jgi:two-component system, cell cycle sensor histidine kinase and response regulator CckA
MNEPLILIVEDEQIVAADLSARLKRMGYQPVGSAARADQAVALAGELRPDLVLMDIRLEGGTDGVAAAREIYQKFRIPSVFVSAYSEEATIERAKLAEPFGYILKPFEDRELRVNIKMALFKHRAAAAHEKLEAQNRQLQKAESLGRMAGAIAHNFNNQLQAVIMNLELALDNLPPDTGTGTNLSEAMKSARKAAAVSTQMLTYLGQTHVQYEPLDLSETCQRGLPLFQGALPAAVVLETELPASGPVISANANQIRQVLTNLLTNACEASREGSGPIRLTVRLVPAAAIPAVNRFPIDWQPRDQAYACLEVADSGCGIAAREIEELFDPFFSTKFTGRGLGLPVVLGIVREHGGSIAVDSEPGRGSAFRVFLPVTVAAVPPKPFPAASAPKTAGPSTVLVAEDERSLCATITRALQRNGYAVIAAVDGVEAVELFEQHRDEICCVLCDLSMPRMGGWETLTALRKLAPGLPVILSSGYDEARVMEGHHPELPQAYLRKPYELKALFNAISRVQTEVCAEKGEGLS